MHRQRQRAAPDTEGPRVPSPWEGTLHHPGVSGAAQPQLSPSSSRTAPRDAHRERDAGEVGCPSTPGPGQLWSRRWALGRGLNTGICDPLLGGSGEAGPHSRRQDPAPAQLHLCLPPAHWAPVPTLPRAGAHFGSFCVPVALS